MLLLTIEPKLVIHIPNGLQVYRELGPDFSMSYENLLVRRVLKLAESLSSV
jgi:hypothetical protein